MSTENVLNEEKGNGVLADVMAMLPSVDDAGVIAVCSIERKTKINSTRRSNVYSRFSRMREVS